MSLTHITALRTILADAVDNYINTTGGGTAKFRLRQTTTTIVDFNLSNPAFGNASSGVITLNSVPIAAVAAATGVVDNGLLLARDGSTVLTFSVTGTGGGGDVEVSNVNVAISQDCTLESLTYAAPV